jgi:hypothetical protein
MAHPQFWRSKSRNNLRVPTLRAFLARRVGFCFLNREPLSNLCRRTEPTHFITRTPTICAKLHAKTDGVRSVSSGRQLA